MWHQFYLATRSVPRHRVKRGDHLCLDLDIDSEKPTTARQIRNGVVIGKFTWVEWCDIMVPCGSTPVPPGEEPVIQTELDLAS
jgi:hypothetical protein